jgi:hypothetical protein
MRVLAETTVMRSSIRLSSNMCRRGAVMRVAFAPGQRAGNGEFHRTKANLPAAGTVASFVELHLLKVGKALPHSCRDYHPDRARASLPRATAARPAPESHIPIRHGTTTTDANP